MRIKNLSAHRVLHVLALLVLALTPLGCMAQADAAQYDDLKAYTSCDMGKDFQVFQVDEPVIDFAWQAPTEAGDIDIPVEVGFRFLVTYRENESFANVKVERLPKAQYTQEKTNLLSSLEYLDSKPGMEPKVQTSSKNGVTLYGISRDKLEGNVLSIYHLFLDDRRIAISMYLINADPAERKFSTIDEYKQVRDKFLDAYSKCVAAVNKPH